jgi:hypothetical protein
MPTLLEDDGLEPDIENSAGSAGPSRVVID